MNFKKLFLVIAGFSASTQNLSTEGKEVTVQAVLDALVNVKAR